MNKFKTLITIASLCLLAACAPNYSSGDRVGVITKLSHKGLIFESWEGSINQGGTKTVTNSEGQQSVVANALDFNVQDPVVIKQLQEAMDKGKQVKITYKQWLLNPITIENNTVVQSVQFLE